MRHKFSPFKQYLRFTKKWINSHKRTNFKDLKSINLVIGNESADLDSTVGSLIYAYYKFCMIQPSAISLLQKEDRMSKVDDHYSYVPIIQFKQEELKSRFDCADILQSNEVNEGDLIFKEDICFKTLNKCKLLVSLFDHNCTTYPELKSSVVDILDHHKDLTRTFYHPNQIIHKQIEQIGSATTLLGEHFMKRQDILDEVIADSIMKTILLDTYNFEPKHEGTRWNNRDNLVYQFMVEYIQNIRGCTIVRNELYDKLERVSYSIPNNLNLGIKILLAKDYKQFTYSNQTRVGYSVILIPPEPLLDHFETTHLENEIKQFISERKLDILVLMFAYPTKEKFERKILVFGDKKSEGKLNQIKNKMNTSLKVSDFDFSPYFKHYKPYHFTCIHHVHAYTRKFLEPLLSSIQFE